MKALSSYQNYLPLVLTLCVGIFVGFLLGGHATQKIPAYLGGSNDIRSDSGNYHFISPLLSCTDNGLGSLQNDDAANLHDDLNALINRETKVGKVSEVSIYFRQFNDGSWIDINGSTTFTPGSLLKVPVVMSVLNYAEDTPGFLDKKITFDTPGIDNEQYYPPSKTIVHGEKYTIPQLAEAALEYSDNNAAYLLANSIDWNNLTDSFTSLGIQNPSPNADATMSVTKYASFFRILYNATYLNRTDSEYVLNLMSQSTFSQGLVAGVPKGVVVSHKFGERELDTTNQLHDCGIVYYPNNPYLLCVMTRGSSYDDLAGTIADISKMVYGYIDSIKK